MRIKILLLAFTMLGSSSAALAQPHHFPYRGPREAPPPPPAEHTETRVGWVWVGGHYRWRDDRYVWVGGHLVRERRGREWHEGRWRRHGADWRWHDGGWHPRR